MISISIFILFHEEKLLFFYDLDFHKKIFKLNKMET